MKIKSAFYVLVIVLAVFSCKKDDGGINIEPPKALSEIIATDEADIKAFLETHFYNYEEFETPPSDFDFVIDIDTIAGDNANKTPLMQMMTAKKVIVRSREIGIDNDKELEHTYYYLVAREGEGPSPTAVDSSFVRYEGSLLNGQVFDGSTESPIWFDLGQIQGPLQGARGFSEGIPNLKGGVVSVLNPDGTYEIDNYGVGLIVFPSALGYYSLQRGSIPEYSPLIFKIDLMAIARADHDRDGVPSYLEDLNGNGYAYDDNTDKKSEEAFFDATIYDFLDDDDDNDGRLTKDEVTFNEYVVDTNMGEQEPDLEENKEYEIDRKNVNGIITIKTVVLTDTNNDGTPDYLDADS